MFGIGIERVVEILKTQKIFTIPGLPEFLSGVISVRGNVVPVIDLRRRFGMKPSGNKERIIIVRYGKEKIGFLIDDIKEILSLPSEEIRTPPSIFKGFKTEYLTGLGKHGDRHNHSPEHRQSSYFRGEDQTHGIHRTFGGKRCRSQQNNSVTAM